MSGVKQGTDIGPYLREKYLREYKVTLAASFLGTTDQHKFYEAIHCRPIIVSGDASFGVPQTQHHDHNRDHNDTGLRPLCHGVRCSWVDAGPSQRPVRRGYVHRTVRLRLSMDVSLFVLLWSYCIL